MTKVEIYTRILCGYCCSARALLERKGVPFVEIDAGGDPEKRREMIERANGAATYPQIFIGGRHVGGADELRALEREGALDRLLNGAST
jgi:glutaredoxin 3